MRCVADWSAELERREQHRSGVRLMEARKRVAHRLGVAPGTLENIRRGRTKGVRAWIAERILNALMRELETEMRRLSHELSRLKKCDLDAREDEVSQVEALLEATREILERRKQ